MIHRNLIANEDLPPHMGHTYSERLRTLLPEDELRARLEVLEASGLARAAQEVRNAIAAKRRP